MGSLLQGTLRQRTSRKGVGQFPSRTWHSEYLSDGICMPFATRQCVLQSAKEMCGICIIVKQFRNAYQRQLKHDERFKIWGKHLLHKLTVELLFSIAFTHAADSMVHGLTVSVRPSRYKRVMEAS